MDVKSIFRIASGSGFETASDIATDRFGYIYIVGTFQENAKFANETHQFQEPAESIDSYVIKLHPNGTVMWKTRTRGISDEVVKFVEVSEDGTVYVHGYFAISATFTSAEPFSNNIILNSTGNTDLFIWIISTLGETQKVIKIGSNGAEDIGSFGIDGPFVYVAFRIGRLALPNELLYIGKTTFSDITVSNVVVFKINAVTETVVSYTSISNGNSNAVVNPYYLKPYSQGVIVVSSVSGSVVLGNTTITIPGAANSFDTVVLMISSNATIAWVSHFSGDANDVSFGSTLDGNREIFWVAGISTGTVLSIYDSSRTIKSNLVHSSSQIKSWVVGLHAKTGLFFTASQFAFEMLTTGVSIDEYGVLYVVGRCPFNTQFHLVPVTSQASVLDSQVLKFVGNTTDFCVAKVAPNGSTLRVLKANSQANSIAARAKFSTVSQELYVVGNIFATSTIGPFTLDYTKASDAVLVTTKLFCSPCPVARYSTERGSLNALTCQLCPAGTYASTIANGNVSLCLPCLQGTWSDQTGLSASTICYKCAVGTYSNELGATRFVDTI